MHAFGLHIFTFLYCQIVINVLIPFSCAAFILETGCLVLILLFAAAYQVHCLNLLPATR
jgi:hypothetical protein